MRFPRLLLLCTALHALSYARVTDANGKEKEEASRDKRALGILLQGFMEALGFTVSPVQLASLPVGPNRPPANASAAPRQRETLRFTGVLNFGNNLNTSNLVNHLAQYERAFHGNATIPAPPASSTTPGAPLFVQLPLPTPGQPAESCEDGSQYSREEDDGSHSREGEYISNQNVENYSLEDRELQDPGEVTRLYLSASPAEWGKVEHHRAREKEIEALNEDPREGSLENTDYDYEEDGDRAEEESRVYERPSSNRSRPSTAPRGKSAGYETEIGREEKAPALRDSYGKRLAMDERVAGYAAMFGAPRVNLPGNRYEEYEIGAKHPKKPKVRDRGIIASLTSYPSSAPPHSPSEQKPSTSRGLLEGAEGAWPAPFDSGLRPIVSTVDYHLENADHYEDGPAVKMGKFRPRGFWKDGQVEGTGRNWKKPSTSKPMKAHLKQSKGDPSRFVIPLVEKKHVSAVKEDRDGATKMTIQGPVVYRYGDVDQVKKYRSTSTVKSQGL